MAISGSGLQTGQLVSHLLVRGVAQAVRYYERALGAVELFRSPLLDATRIHAQLKVGNSLVLLPERTQSLASRSQG